MAKKTVIELVDDLDGTVISQGRGATHRFSLDSDSYEIDLSAANAARLREALAPFVAAARRSSAPKRARASASSSAELQAIRRWARANGHTVSDRGRISAEIRAAYAAAH